MKYLIILSIFLYSCSAQKRINRICKNHPEVCRIDTIVVRDTIRIAPHSVDTIIENVIGDTVVVQDSIMVIKYYNDGKKVYLKGEVRERKVPYEKKVFVDRPVIREVEKVKPWYIKYLWWWFLLTLGVIIGRIGWKFVKGYIKPLDV